MAEQKQLVFLFDTTRVRSHLLHKYLCTSPEVAGINHPFLMAGMFGPECLAQHLRHSDAREQELNQFRKGNQIDANFESSKTELITGIAKAHEKHLVPLAKEHWFNVVKAEYVQGMLRGTITHAAQLPKNPTHIPDDIFSTMAPVILIRHPALAINSDYRDVLKFTQQRPGDEDFSVICVLQPMRLLYDHFAAQGQRPIVVDAEDILWRTEDMARGFCAALGNSFDASSLSETWEPASKERIARMIPMVYQITKTIQDSSGIQRPEKKPEEPDLSQTIQKWTEMYGDTVASQLKELAEANMPHYEYLKQFKV